MTPSRDNHVSYTASNVLIMQLHKIKLYITMYNKFKKMQDIASGIKKLPSYQNPCVVYGLKYVIPWLYIHSQEYTQHKRSPKIP